MHITSILNILGLLLMVFSFTMVPPALIALWFGDGGEEYFLSAFFMILMVGLVCWLPFYNRKAELRVRDGFLIVVLFWSALGLTGAVPFLLTNALDLSVADALFESLSGLTTTGATVIVGLDDLPKSLLFYRHQLQWLGGVGIIVLAVAILPMLGIGGMQLYRAETPGPVKDSKLTPRITETAKALWYIYLSLTVVCAFVYWLAGMSVFDAVCHSFSTIAIGGFSTHDASLGYFDSVWIEMTAVFFMLLAGINFGLHFFAWQKNSVFHYFRDKEFKFYITIISMVTLLVIYSLYARGVYDTFGDAFRYGIFHVVSGITTTGFGIADNYTTTWPEFIPVMIIFLSFFGGCAGSTAGGMKMMRILLVYKQVGREVVRLIHPNAVVALKLGKKAVPDRVIEAVWGFVAVYTALFIALTILLMITGVDHYTAFSAIAACLNNLGPGLGNAAQNYAEINSPAKFILCFTMLLGRLEVFTLLVIFNPMFWRR